MKLRQLCDKDVDGMLEWMHDQNIQNNFRKPMLDKTREEALAFIKMATTIPQEGGSVHYAIVDDNDEYLGTISLKNIDIQNRSAEYAISLRKKAQGKGIGTWATREILHIAFGQFGMHRIYLNVLADNKVAIALYEKCGFIYEGNFRDCLYLRGKYHDLMWFSILNQDYKLKKELNN